MLTEKSAFSPLWPRVAGLRPRLRPDAPIHRHVFRGQLWYVVQDPGAGRFHRFTPAAYTLVGLMDGRHTMQEIWETAGRSLGDELPAQEEVIQLLSQLHQGDLLLTDVPPDVVEIAERGAVLQRRGRLSRIMNPLALRIPLWDPDRFLKATLPVVGPLYSWAGLVVWLIVVGWAVMLAGIHWSELTGNITDRVMAAGNLLVLVLTYPFVKAIHELSHGYATRKWEGEVHEMGIMFLVLVPIPYVDATAASAFRERGRRVLVGAAGMLAEVFLAALAMLVWVQAEPGLVRSIAFNVMLIAGVSTVLFNGNPLLRYDGYYILADALEIPNLATRATRYIGYLVQRYLFRVRHVVSPATARGEPFWFVTFGVLSFCYRLFVWSVIVIVVATKFFFVGVLLAVWGALLMFVRPLARNMSFLVTSPVLAGQRGRAMTITLVVLAAVLLVLFAVPVPRSTVVDGVVWLPERSVVNARTSGFVARVEATPSGDVAAGAPLLTLEDPLLEAQVRGLEAEVAQLELAYAALRTSDVVQAEVTRQELDFARAGLTRAREEMAGLNILSPVAGRFILPRAEDMPGRFVEKGEVVGYVVEPRATFLRVVLNQDEIDPVRSSTRAVTVRLAGRMGRIYPVESVREVPAASHSLPSRVLSTEGGGRAFLDPRDPSGARTLQSVFHLELVLDTAETADFVGRRAWVRFDHGPEPLPARWYRALRQLFLSKFSV